MSSILKQNQTSSQRRIRKPDSVLSPREWKPNISKLSFPSRDILPEYGICSPLPVIRLCLVPLLSLLQSSLEIMWKSQVRPRDFFRHVLPLWTISIKCISQVERFVRERKFRNNLPHTPAPFKICKSLMQFKEQVIWCVCGGWRCLFSFYYSLSHRYTIVLKFMAWCAEFLHSKCVSLLHLHPFPLLPPLYVNQFCNPRSKVCHCLILFLLFCRFTCHRWYHNII